MMVRRDAKKPSEGTALPFPSRVRGYPVEIVAR